MKETICFIEDQELIVNPLRSFLERKGYGVFHFKSGKEFLEREKGLKFDIAVVDINLPDVSGEEIVEFIHDTHPEAKIIITTGDVTIPISVKANTVLYKPFSLKNFMKTLMSVSEAKNNLYTEG